MNNSRLPSRPFRGRGNFQGKGDFRGQGPLAMSGKQNLYHPPRVYRQDEIPWNEDDDGKSPNQVKIYKKAFGLACLLYPCLEAEVVREILVNHNLVLDDSSLETLKNRCQSIHNNHVHSFQLDELEITSYKSRPCSELSSCTNPYCPDYHYLGEKRRYPVLYSSVLCQKHLSCPSGDACEFSHTANEQAYHPERLALFYTDSEFDPDEKPDISSLDEISLERLKEKKLNEKLELINNLENRFVWLTTLKSKYFCCTCKSSPSVSIAVPCGHLYCESCKSQSFCPKCRVPCNFYQLHRRQVF